MSEVILIAITIACVTGWCLYLDERGKRKKCTKARRIRRINMF